MRALGVSVAFSLALLVGASPAEATSCRYVSALERFEEAPGAATATLVSTRVVGPPLPLGVPRIGGAASGPVVELSYRLRRVYKGGADGLQGGDLVFSEYRVNHLPTPGRVDGLLFFRVDGRLVPSGRGLCSFGMSPRGMRRAALLNRYGAGGSASLHNCGVRGIACRSIKREGRDAILRFASFRRESSYRLCVTAPGGTRTCRRFQLEPERDGLYASRVRWSAHFPDRGRGTYRVEWPDSPLMRGPLTFDR